MNKNTTKSRVKTVYKPYIVKSKYKQKNPQKPLEQNTIPFKKKKKPNMKLWNKTKRTKAFDGNVEIERKYYSYTFFISL